MFLGKISFFQMDKIYSVGDFLRQMTSNEVNCCQLIVIDANDERQTDVMRHFRHR